MFENDPRVEDVWDEGPDGIWCSLAQGYSWDGTSSLHEWTVRDILRRRKEIEKCDAC